MKQAAGQSKDHVAELVLENAAQAREHYIIARNRLLNVNAWRDYAGFFSASFELTDHRGNKKEGNPIPGDHFRIALPSPAPGDHYDWVRVEKVDEEKGDDHEITMIRVRPATDPTSGDGETQHFFSDHATSNFLVRREGNRLYAEVHGRNEEANLEQAGSLSTGLRNMVVAAGALMGFSDMQWNKLVKGLLENT